MTQDNKKYRIFTLYLNEWRLSLSQTGSTFAKLRNTRFSVYECKLFSQKCHAFMNFYMIHLKPNDIKTSLTGFKLFITNPTDCTMMATISDNAFRSTCSITTADLYPTPRQCRHKLQFIKKKLEILNVWFFQMQFY